MSSVIFAVLGAVFFWWVPLGIVFGMTGLLLGFADWSVAIRRSEDYRLAVAAMLIAVAALVLDIVIASLGLQIWTFGSLI